LLARLSDEHHLDQSPCISIAGTDSFSLLLVEAPEVDPSELKAAVRWRIKDLLDFHIDDAIIDVFDIPGQQERGRPKLMYVVASRIATVQAHIDRLERHDIQLTTIDIPELAIRNVAALLPEDADGVAMLYLGGNFGLLTMTRNNSLYLARKLDIGTEQLLGYLEAARENEEFVLDEAEGMPPALQQVLGAIVLEVQRSLDYYESHFSLPQVAGLVMVPMIQPIPGMMGYLAGNLGVPVRMLDLNAVLDCHQTLSDELQSRCLLAIGAALRQEQRAL
jgi:MSHA biogenesis protein MshI